MMSRDERRDPAARLDVMGRKSGCARENYRLCLVVTYSQDE